MRLGSSGPSVKIWDAANGQEPLALLPQDRQVYSVAFSPSGKHVAAVIVDGGVRIDPLRLQGSMALASAYMSRALTTEECQAYLYTKQCLAAR
jgi:WD40 repeat protein